MRTSISAIRAGACAAVSTAVGAAVLEAVERPEEPESLDLDLELGDPSF
jgi:hypothetical protein